MAHFQSFLASIDYSLHLPYGKYYQSIFFVVFKLIGASIDSAKCRIDVWKETTLADKAS